MTHYKQQNITLSSFTNAIIIIIIISSIIISIIII